LVTQAANTIFAGPSSGSGATPAFRALTSGDLPLATTTAVGAVQVGSGLSVDGSGVLSANSPAIATSVSLGVVKVGSGLSVDGTGLLTANAPAVATASSLGVVKVGSGLSVDGTGLLAANAPAVATASSLGVVKVGSGLSVDGAGLLTANAPAVATTSSLGVVKVGSGLSVNGSGVLSVSNAYSVGVPALSSFTVVNQSSFTLSEVSGSSITAAGPGASGWNNCVLYQNAPSTPYRLAAFLSVGAAAVNYFGSGIGFYDPATSKFVEVFFCWNLNKVCNIQVSKWTSPTAFSATPVTWGWSMNSGGFWLGIRDDGTNVYYEYSGDGANFTTIYSEVKSSGFLAGAYGHIAYIINPNTGGSANTINSTLFVWDTNGLSRAPSILG
jgi:hypothetical protein